MNDSVYLSIAGVDPGWIIGKILDDIQNHLHAKGVACRSGSPSEYDGEDICYHLGYAYAKPRNRAKVNSVFITHIDDVLKEKLLLSIKDDFDSFVCMSSDDRNYLIELGLDPKKVFGPTLPVRNDYIKPLSLGIFSSCYDDGRKNEAWLLKFAKSNIDASLLNYVFIGSSWAKFLKEFSDLGCSFEWHNANRNLPYEYQFQQEKLSRLDYYFYLGFDGGAMGSYDGYAYGNKLILISESYHLDMPRVDYPITSYRDFEKIFSSIAKDQRTKLDFFHSNSVKSYVEKLEKIWLNQSIGNLALDENNTSILKKRRSQYKPLSLIRLLGMLKRKFFKLI